MTAYYLSEQDVLILRAMAEDFRQGNIGNHKGRTTIYTEEAQSPDVQIVIPEADIPGSTTDDGAPVEVGTCQVQTLVRETLEQVGEVPIEAWNIRNETAKAGVPYIAVKTKLGKYVLIDPNTGGGAPRIRFTIISAALTIGDGALGCDYVVGVVNHITCNTTSVAVGDEVKIYDPEYCHFNLPIELLVGLNGTATLMDSTSYQPTLTGTGTGTAAGTGTGTDGTLDCVDEIRAAGCIWMIDTLCCSEEEYISGTA